jgi:hypothetical protein
MPREETGFIIAIGNLRFREDGVAPEGHFDGLALQPIDLGQHEYTRDLHRRCRAAIETRA